MLGLVIKCTGYTDDFYYDLKERYPEIVMENVYGNTMLIGDAYLMFNAIVAVLQRNMFDNSSEISAKDEGANNKQRKMVIDFVVNEWPGFKKFMQC